MTLGFISSGARGFVCGDPGDEIAFGLMADQGAYLHKTFATKGNTTKWTKRYWIKRCELGILLAISGTANGGSYQAYQEYFATTDTFNITHNQSGAAGSDAAFSSSRKFRDPAAHMEVIEVWDTTQADQNERHRVYFNGIRAPLSDHIVKPIQGRESRWNQANIQHRINSYQVNGISGGAWYFGEHILGDYIFLDDIAADPSAFGYFNSDGHRVARKYSGPYGANGFHLDFADPLNLGKDISGNGNHFTPVNMTTANQVADTPSNNFSTLNPAAPTASTFSGGALVASIPYKANSIVRSTFAFDETMSVYWEVKSDSGAVGHKGILPVSSKATYYPGNDYYAPGANTGDGYSLGSDGSLYHKGSILMNLGSNGLGDVFGFHWDHGNVYLYKNGAILNGGAAIITGLTGKWYAAAGNNFASAAVMSFNFGQRPWAYGPPNADVVTLSTGDTPCPEILDPADYVTTREKSGGAGVDDAWNMAANKSLVLSKRTDTTTDWLAVDTVLGAGKAWSTNDPTNGVVDEADGITGFTANGFTVGANAAYQGSRQDYLFRASPKAGFDIVTVNHTGGTTTVPHNAGGRIEYAWVVPINAGGGRRIFHHALPAGTYLLLDTQIAATSDAGWFSSTANDVSIGGSLAAGQYQLYLWRGVPQFSTFDHHFGNGSADGPLTYCDFAPLLDFCRKSAAGESNWVQEAGENPVTSMRYLNTTTGTYSHVGYSVDFIGNGIKWRTTDSSWNASGVEFITAIWAAAPLKFTRAR